MISIFGSRLVLPSPSPNQILEYFCIIAQYTSAAAVQDETLRSRDFNPFFSDGFRPHSIGIGSGPIPATTVSYPEPAQVKHTRINTNRRIPSRPSPRSSSVLSSGTPRSPSSSGPHLLAIRKIKTKPPLVEGKPKGLLAAASSIGSC